MGPDRDDLYWSLRTENDRFICDQAHYWRYIHPRIGAASRDYRRLAWDAQDRLTDLITNLGYRASPTVANAPWDLWIEGAKVEVKAARWSQRRAGGGRYHATIRNHQADLVAFDCVNGSHHWYLIPMAEITPRVAVEITSYDVSAYAGRWAGWLDHWQALHEAVHRAAAGGWQLPLPLVTPGISEAGQAVTKKEQSWTC